MPFLIARFLEGSEAFGAAGVVDQHVDGAEARDGFIDDTLEIGLFGNVASDSKRLSACFANGLRRAVQFLGAARGHGDLRALCGKSSRNRTTDAFAGAGNEYRFS